MKRSLIILALVVVATSAFAEDQRNVKRALIRELLNVIDSKALTESVLDAMFSPAEVAKNMSKDADSARTYREELYARIDFAKFAEEVYAPILDQTCDVSELKQLIAFYKNPAGRKSTKVMAQLVLGTFIRGSGLIAGAGVEVRDEIQNKDRAAHPWIGTMADLRTLATATEAYATDVNKYPNAKSIGELRSILSPTYIKKVPEKDGWGTPYLYVVSKDGMHYRFVSAGADKRFDSNSTTMAILPQSARGKASENLDDDIIYEDGLFIQYPAVSVRQK